MVDYGIRGLHLAYDLLPGWERLVLVDALPDHGDPGRLEVIEVGPEHLGVGELDAHGMAPVAVLASLGALGGRLPPTVLVGTQVSDVPERMGLSADVEALVTEAVAAIQALLREPRQTTGRLLREEAR